MPRRQDAPPPTRAPERAGAADAERWLAFLELEHGTLAPVVSVARDGDAVLVTREPVAGRRIGDARVPRPHAAALLLQGAAAAAFFAGRGFPLAPEDLD